MNTSQVVRQARKLHPEKKLSFLSKRGYGSVVAQSQRGYSMALITWRCIDERALFKNVTPPEWIVACVAALFDRNPSQQIATDRQYSSLSLTSTRNMHSYASSSRRVAGWRSLHIIRSVSLPALSEIYAGGWHGHANKHAIHLLRYLFVPIYSGPTLFRLADSPEVRLPSRDVGIRQTAMENALHRVSDSCHPLHGASIGGEIYSARIPTTIDLVVGPRNETCTFQPSAHG